jgi:hypothetical protein
MRKNKVDLPSSVRYVKNGKGGQWWKVAKTNNQIHLGWRNIPRHLLTNPDFQKIEAQTRKHFGAKPGAVQDFNQLKDLLDSPSTNIWVTFEDGFMWWCTVRDSAQCNPDGESDEKGNFWLVCERPWSNRSLGGKFLAVSDLPGPVTKTSGFRGTVCTPREWQTIIRIIRDEKDPFATKAIKAREGYKEAIFDMIKQLHWKDFEQLIDLVLFRSGWVRIRTFDSTAEGIDTDVENPATAEIAFVQVKSSATQHTLEDYIQKFENRRERYARMIFAVHSPVGKIAVPQGCLLVQVWDATRVADLSVRLGLGEWIEGRLA